MKWKQFFEYIFRTVGGKLIFLCNYNPKTINIKAPNIYLDFLNIWNYLKEKEYIVKETHNENQIIFNNNFIEGRIIPFNAKLFHVNIFQVKHLTDAEGDMRSGDYFIRKGLNVDDLFFLNDLYTKLTAAWKIKRICRGRDDILNDTVDLSNINFIINKTVYSFESVSSKMLYNIFIAIIQDAFAFKHPEVIALNLDKSKLQQVSQSLDFHSRWEFKGISV